MVIDKLKRRISKNEAGPRHIVALDIGTEYVKALIGRVAENVDNPSDQTVEVVGVGRKHQRLSDMYSGAISDIAGVVENCDAALNQAEETAGVTARDVVIGIAGELVKGNTTTIKYMRSDPKKELDTQEFSRIINKVQVRALERAQAQLAWESNTSDIEIKMVNAAVVNVMIDGYKVTNPIGFQGKEVSIQLFCAFAPLVHLAALERVAFDLDLNLLSIAAEPFAVAKSVGAEASENFNAIFIDVGGGTTDIAVVNEGGVEGTKMFGIGGRSFTNTIARTLGVDFEEAEKLKLGLSQAEAPDREQEVRDALKPTVKVWLSGVEIALSEFEAVDQLPTKLLLCGGGTGLRYIPKALESKKWRADLPFTKDISVTHIRPDQVERVKDTTGRLKDYSYITPMGLLNLGLDALDTSSSSQKLINKLNQTMKV